MTNNNNMNFFGIFSFVFLIPVATIVFLASLERWGECLDAPMKGDGCTNVKHRFEVVGNDKMCICKTP
jgi:hypothetical protein